MNLRWSDLKIGNIFKVDNCFSSIDHIYIKIDGRDTIYNAVSLNNGELCNLYVESLRFSKVELAFE